MPWLCSKCGTNNVNANKQCVICYSNGVIVPRGKVGFDENDLLSNKVLLYKLSVYDRYGDMSMTESEKLFANFFSEEKILVSSMNDLELRAHREELSKIAFEAKARLTATDHDMRERNAKSKAKKGLSVSLETDDITSDAIHSINERQKKMSKQDKQIAAMVKMGVSQEDAENMFKASTLLALTKAKKTGEKISIEGLKKINPILKDIRGKCPTCLFDFENKIGGETICPKCETKVHVEIVKKAVNPFAKKLEEIKEEDKNFLVELANANVAKEELVAIAEDMITEKKSFNPFKKTVP